MRLRIRGMGDMCNPETGENCFVAGGWQTNPWARFLATNSGTALDVSLALISGEAEMRRAQQWLENWVEPFASSAKPGAPPFRRTAPSPGTGLATPATQTPDQIRATGVTPSSAVTTQTSTTSIKPAYVAAGMGMLGLIALVLMKGR